jgi:hypothetical protein
MSNRTPRQMVVIVLTTVLAALLLASCNNDEKGSLQLSFQLGSGKSCTAFSIKKVAAVLVSKEKDQGDSYEEKVNCSDGEIRFSDIPSGSYTIKLYGYDSKNVAVKDSEPQDVTVKAGKTVTIETSIRLLDAPAVLKVGWNLGLSSCKLAQIGGFSITAYNADGSDILFEDKKVACTDSNIDDEGYHVIPDEDRDLKGDNFGEVDIQPYDTNSEPLGDPIQFTFDSRGPGGVIELLLTCDKTGCEGSGEPEN